MIQPYPHQLRAADHLASVLPSLGAALDGSDTGIGKTVTALCVARTLNRRPLIVCPKAIISSWAHTAREMGVEPLAVLNVEKLRTGKQPWVLKGARKDAWFWQLPADSFVIWDEVHGCGGHRTLNAYLLANLKWRVPTLMLSATVADSPLRLQAPGYLLGLHKFKDHLQWCLRHACYIHPVYGGLEFNRGPQGRNAMLAIHQEIFPKRGTRIRIKDIPDFPETLIMGEAVDVTVDRNEVNALCGESFWNDEMDPGKQTCALTGLLRARQMTEIAKVPVILDMVEDRIDENHNVVVFVCFLDTMGLLLKGLDERKLGPVSVIHGQQTKTERDEAIARFQGDESRILVSIIQAGGVGISLHDLHGRHPRSSILTPPLSVVQLKQALGRIHRAGARSKSVQTILFAAGTVEEEACHGLKRKLDQLTLLNDGELSDPIIIKKEQVHEKVDSPSAPA